ncbi:phage portal protein [Alteriqipengyuania lutimaris]|uniref:Phage portal protein n=1 Tax=Alteriqipengyuania lutimaris TaxID=1538146 RepID=A0A395LH74_9SPHN|nr:phage portal protein [Alteriqipengyuania lutimaris]MBB3035386.1 HK97 family phage portal protein [Alteriqipengyuania lutimaris]RDS75969.1 phage portal protein [Alteriqipengyuania lutimaris]
MGFLTRARDLWSGGRAEERSIEDPKYSLAENPEALMSLFGIMDRNNALPRVSIEAALSVPAVFCAVAFLSRTMAALPLHTFDAGENGDRADDGPAQLLSFAPNEGETSFDWRRYHWQQVFTGGRGLSWIERAGKRPIAIWPMDPALTEIKRRSGRVVYVFDGREYPAADVIDTCYMPKRDRLGSYSPIEKCNLAISLAIAMQDFAGGFFAGGGVPPYALEGPQPSNQDAFRRAKEAIDRAIKQAKKENRAFFGLPPGHSLKSIGIEPGKGQMVEARLFQIQEIARVWQLPPVFLADLSKGTFSNTEQQDLQLVKHLVGQWAKQFEDQLTLKLYGWRNPERRVKHNLDGLQRGDFKSRVEAMARSILTAQMTPDEARALEGRPKADGGDRLYVQQATVPLTNAGMGHNGGPPLDETGSQTSSNDEEEEEGADDDAGTEE